jgi:hypothetical protein
VFSLPSSDPIRRDADTARVLSFRGIGSRRIGANHHLLNSWIRQWAACMVDQTTPRSMRIDSRPTFASGDPRFDESSRSWQKLVPGARL